MLIALPYNSHMGHGPTLNSTTYMHYGRLSATIKSSKVGGAITAVILISDTGDEIDFEVIGCKHNSPLVSMPSMTDSTSCSRRSYCTVSQ